ncbi:hypothetical protein MASSI9I_20770 [Massilia sp. 9I]|nr:hypothetical protein MASSI9I_20770 [Massilia sp. 9I]
MALFLALYLAAFGGRPLTVTLLYGVRTFLPPSPEDEDQRLSGLLHGQHCNRLDAPNPARRPRFLKFRVAISKSFPTSST